MIINGKTDFLTLLGDPIHSVKAPMIYNPYLQELNINTILLPIEVSPEQFPFVLKALLQVKNFRGSLITMPHKVNAISLVDELSTTAKIAGACNAIKIADDGKVIGDMFDGEGFVRGMTRKGINPQGKKAFVVGSGGVGSAIAASLAAVGITKLCLSDTRQGSAQSLGNRLKTHYPELEIAFQTDSLAEYDIVVNATPLGMNDNDPLPLDVTLLNPNQFIGEVVMKKEVTPFLKAAQTLGCKTQIGTDMLFEQIPAYLEFFNFPTTTAEHLREVAQIKYL
ncbi:shikimate dehydrogenase [Entomomonas sp. E2T0]|uniref:shikimate dehydrogenase family protein n=1 Tax=Entomomonas sp. E2T0 TaxID=2930213 RepID=UPI0022282FD9|nr:shikimate dehydrogenase [Entomomonas sp. E2T0]UYZ83941.1 shikimate dehydrogenase [Entomomonas sp. E2T0]